jgi:ribosomal protein L37AE/L43A
MADRSLRGTRLGASSFEDDRDIELAARQVVSFDCPQGHLTAVPMAEEAEVPVQWECRECGATALRRGYQPPPPKAVKPPRTHWDMLLERRSIAELEALLEERLELINPRAASRRKTA